MAQQDGKEESKSNLDVDDHFVKINEILNKQYLSKEAQKILRGPVIKSDLSGYVNRDTKSVGSQGKASARSD